MKTLRKIKTNPIVYTALCFGVASLILNIVSVWLLKTAHINDIIHVFLTIFIYGPIVEWLGGGIPHAMIFVPLAVIVDMLVGVLVGLGIRKWVKKDTYHTIGIWVSFAIYWILITFQWLPLL
ncbi:MAG: hypothetical protein ACRCTE_13675 [Cellulosilyticaceae bacterium]